MTDTLRERVARAMARKAYSTGGLERVADPYTPDAEYWDGLADAAIALVLEEAARVAEMLGGSVRKGNIIEALYVPPTAKDIAAAIRAMKEKTNDRQ